MLGYGILLIALGLYGFLKARSIPSLVSGVGFGVLLSISAWGMFKKRQAGAYAAVLLTAALTVVFVYRYLQTEKTLPATLAILSGAMLLFQIVQVVRWKR